MALNPVAYTEVAGMRLVTRIVTAEFVGVVGLERLTTAPPAASPRTTPATPKS